MISIEEARKILGESANNMDDEKIKSILGFLYFVCEKVVDNLNNNAN